MAIKLKNIQNAMLTDLYELTMAASYYEQGIFAPATFSLFIRKYPPDRGYFVSAGLNQVLYFLESFSFDQEDLDYLHSKNLFSNAFLDYLGRLRFTGDINAIEEGSIFFKDEPILELTAPIIQGQLVETFIINAIKSIRNPKPFPVDLSPKLKDLQEQIIRKIKNKMLGIR
jgi:nicotinate phosphoribosyltransferase